MFRWLLMILVVCPCPCRWGDAQISPVQAKAIATCSCHHCDTNADPVERDPERPNNECPRCRAMPAVPPSRTTWNVASDIALWDILPNLSAVENFNSARLHSAEFEVCRILEFDDSSAGRRLRLTI